MGVLSVKLRYLEFRSFSRQLFQVKNRAAIEPKTTFKYILSPESSRFHSEVWTKFASKVVFRLLNMLLFLEGFKEFKTTLNYFLTWNLGDSSWFNSKIVSKFWVK